MNLPHGETYILFSGLNQRYSPLQEISLNIMLQGSFSSDHKMPSIVFKRSSLRSIRTNFQRNRSTLIFAFAQDTYSALLTESHLRLTYTPDPIRT